MKRIEKLIMNRCPDEMRESGSICPKACVEGYTCEQCWNEEAEEEEQG